VPAGVVELDLEALEREGYIRPEGSGTAQAQEFRRIKRQLLNRIDRQRQLLASPKAARTAENRAARSVPPNLVMVTSALAGEGKTSVTINLAMSLAAEVDHTVLLVDGDIAKSDLTRQFNLMDRVGLGEVLKNPSMVSEALLGTNVPRLSVIPAGQYQENLDELFASDLMQSFAISLAEDNPDRIVVFDSAPLLVTTEAAVLAEHMSEILMVVEANRTPKEAVTQALAEFNDYERVSLILNKISGNSRFSQGYGYGYGYGYGKAQESGNTAEMDAVKTGTHS
jgi:exopolysaccharide/PEP-CTERM locus tyrosine autokinase